MSEERQHTSANLPPDNGSITVEGRRVVILQAPSAAGHLQRLTEAEQAVVLLAAEGQTNAQIAARRERSPRTIANQLRSAYRKLGLQSRAQLVRRFAAPGNR